MKYSATSALAKVVCDHIGFNFDIKPIQVIHRNNFIYIRGTALKPDEWLNLRYQLTHFPTLMIEGKEYRLKSNQFGTYNFEREMEKDALRREYFANIK